MKRKTLFLTIPFIISLFIIFQNIKLYVILSCVYFFAGIILIKLKKMQMKQFFITVLSCMLACSLFSGYNLSKNELINKYTTGIHTFSGKITNIKEYAQDKTSYTLRGKFENGKKAVLSVYTDDIGGKYGDIITLKSDFTTYENNYLFSSYDYNAGKNIYLNPQNVEEISLKSNDSAKNRLICSVKDYRKQISSKINQKYGTATGGIVNAMMFGDKTNLDDNQKTAFYRTGIGHVMAISGLHLVFFISLICFLLKKLRIPKIITFLISIIAVILFSICVDSPVSVIRAGVMIILSKQAELIFRKNDPLNSLMLCVFFMLLIQPYLIINSSFLLSVSGTYGISVASPYFVEKIRKHFNTPKILNSLITMICVSLCVFPVSAMFFDETSIVSPVSNIFLVPICMAVLFLSFIIFLTTGFSPIMEFFKPVIKLLVFIIVKITDFTASMPFSHISFGKKYFGTAFLFMAAITAVIYLLYKNLKFTAFTISFSIFVSSVLYFYDSVKEKNYLKIAILGDNKNCVAIIRYKNTNIVYDMTGKSNSADYAQKYIQQNGINNISSLVLNKNQAYSAALFNGTNICTSISSVIMPSEYKDWICNSKISNCTPTYTNGNLSISQNDLNIESKTDMLFISSDNFKFALCEKTDDLNEKCNAVYIYGNKTNNFSNYETNTFSGKKFLNMADIKYYSKHYRANFSHLNSPFDTMLEMNYMFLPKYSCNYNIEFLIDKNGKLTERKIK